MDAIKERGFAVVLPRNNNLNTLYKAAQDQRDNQIRQQEQIGKEFENIKLGMPSVRTELMGGAASLLKDTYSGMNSIQREAYQRGGLTPEHRTAINNLKQNWDIQKGFIESYNTDMDKVAEVVGKDEKLYDQAAFTGVMKDHLANSFDKDEGGNIVGFKSTKLPSSVLQDSRIYNKGELNKRWIDELGEVSNDVEIDNFGSTAKQEATANLFEWESDGKGSQKIKRDPNTGKPIPSANPESILSYDANPVRKQTLDDYAKSITKEGENWEQNRSKAFKQFIVGQYATTKEDKTIKDQTDSSISRGEKLANIESRYKTLRNAVYSFDETSLAQANNVMNNVQLEFRGGGEKGNLPGEVIPDRIVIKKREAVDVPIDPNVPALGVKRQYVWNEYELPIRNDQQKEKALFEINTVLDEAGDKSGLKIGNDAIRVVHDKYKSKNKLNKLSADDYKLN